jgi:hypothetical protein
MRSSQESILICSTFDCLLWEQQTLAQIEFTRFGECVHSYVCG